MATAPAYAATPGMECANLTTVPVGTLRDGTGTNIVTILTAGSSGTRIEEIVAKSEGNPADSTIVFFLHDGSAYHVFDEWDIGDPAAGSATVASYREARRYDSLVLPSGWTLRAAISATPTSGGVQITAEAGDF